MPQPVDVGSVLGGRYKVTAHVMSSAEHDLVLEGMDQVLNRPVSILVAAPANASQVATSAREVATGERPGTVQVLDLGVSDGTTYLVTSQAQPADLLDLVISRDAPFIEPFFTETLGSEIFGVPRSTEPETYDDEDDEEDYDDEPHRPLLPRLNLPKVRRPTDPAQRQRPAVSGAAAAGAAAAGAAAAGTAGSALGGTPAGTASGPAGAAAGAAPSAGPSVPPPPASQPRSAMNRTAAIPTSAGGTGGGQRPPSSFPLSAREAGDNYSAQGYSEYDEDDIEERPQRSSRLLVGAVLALLVIAAVVVAVTQLGGLFRAPVAAPTPGGGTSAATSAQQSSGSGTPAATSARPPAAAPRIAGVSRLVPGNQELDAPNDAKLPQAVDGNPASFWSSYVYASNTFGGLADSMALVVELEEPADVTSVRLTQLNGSGGKFSVMLSDQADLDAARRVADGSFTAPSVTVPVRAAANDDGPVKYVIINFTELPRLSNTTGPYPFGLQVAEIEVS